jgi:hypothetical protein
MQVLAPIVLAALAAVFIGASENTNGEWDDRAAVIRTTQPGQEHRPIAPLKPTLGPRRAPAAKPDPEDTVVTRVCYAPSDCVEKEFAQVENSPGKAAPKRRAEPGRSDVARFLVGTPTVEVEPGAWTVVGAQTNFVVTGARERTESGVLLGQPVAVRFAPVEYRWAYGDGETRSTSVPGATWQASASPPFAVTPTSHAFARRGGYAVTVEVEFTAQYRFAGESWRPIPGTLALTSKPVTVLVKSTSTVLVGHDCIQRPSGPGCSP